MIIKPKYKKIFLIIASFLVISIIIIMASAPKSPETQYLEKKDQLPQGLSKDLPFETDNKLQPEIPNELPSYSFSFKTISEEQAQKISQNIGLNTRPTKISDITDGLKLLWSDTKNTLIVTPKNGHLTYHNNNPPSEDSSKLTEDQLKDVAKQFLVQKFDINSNDIIFSTIHHLRPSASGDGGYTETTVNNSTLLQINFTYQNVAYPIFTNSPLHQIIFVQLDPRGSILRADANLINPVNIQENTVPLKNFNEIQRSLDEARLINVENDYISISDIKKEDITNIKIQKVETGYLYNNQLSNLNLFPIFLLSGELTIKNSPANYARLFLDAAK